MISGVSAMRQALGLLARRVAHSSSGAGSAVGAAPSALPTLAPRAGAAGSLRTAEQLRGAEAQQLALSPAPSSFEQGPLLQLAQEWPRQRAGRLRLLLQPPAQTPLLRLSRTPPAQCSTTRLTIPVTPLVTPASARSLTSFLAVDASSTPLPSASPCLNSSSP